MKTKEFNRTDAINYILKRINDTHSEKDKKDIYLFTDKELIEIIEQIKQSDL